MHCLPSRNRLWCRRLECLGLDSLVFQQFALRLKAILEWWPMIDPGRAPLTPHEWARQNNYQYTCDCMMPQLLLSPIAFSGLIWLWVKSLSPRFPITNHCFPIIVGDCPPLVGWLILTHNSHVWLTSYADADDVLHWAARRLRLPPSCLRTNLYIRLRDLAREIKNIKVKRLAHDIKWFYDLIMEPWNTLDFSFILHLVQTSPTPGIWDIFYSIH